MPTTIRAHLRASFNRRLHPEITRGKFVKDEQFWVVKIEKVRVHLPANKVVEAQRKYPFCVFCDQYLTMEAKHKDLCACIDFLAESEHLPSDGGVHNGRRKSPRAIVMR